MGEPRDDWRLHFDIERAVPQAPERIGYAALQHAVDRGQRGRVKRAVSTLVGLDVLAWAGQRQGRAVAQGPRTLDEVLADGLTPMPDREIQTYPLLLAPVDEAIAAWHRRRGDEIDESEAESAFGDGVTPYVTSATRVVRDGEPATHTRPDLTVIVDLHYDNFGAWNEVHAVEVKPYWAVDRSALFEAAAQAALRRCTFSWLLVWIPSPDSGHFTRPQIKLISAAEQALGALEREAANLGLGLFVARELSEVTGLKVLVDPRRQAMEPSAADELFRALDRTDGIRSV